VIVIKLAGLAGLELKQKRKRTLPANRRYMPPPTDTTGTMTARMRREVVLSFCPA
jgi:hypothetical protein